MAVEIPFNRDIVVEYGRVDRVSPLIRRVVAHNPGPFTFLGTGTYIVGNGKVAVIDPGPDMPEHVQAILDALEPGETVSHIVITHTHMDHSPAARPLQAATGAPTYGFGPHGSGPHTFDWGARDGAAAEEGGDVGFKPDHAVRHGERIEGDGWTLEAVHTPGHTSNHLCFQLVEEKALFSGDHVMGWSTSVISPPDGDMTAYMRSLRLLLERDDAVYWPTHGAPIRDPKPFVRAFIAHREDRERQIAECLSRGVTRIPAMVEVMYANVDKGLHPAAARSVLSHLAHMVESGRARADGPLRLSAEFHPA
jgi:glyoxylase-like metal-dependent hydrolase (beta-lactamase superfamily II)